MAVFASCTPQPKTFTTEEPLVKAEELNCVKKAFAAHIRWKDNITQVIEITDTLFSIASFEKAIKENECTGTERMAAMVHFGRTDDPLLTFAIQFVCLEEYAKDLYRVQEMPAQYYLIEEEALVLQETDITEWIEEYGDRYSDHVMIKRSTDSDFDEYLSGYDVTSVLYPMDRLLRLVEANRGGGTVSIVPIAEPTERIEIAVNKYIENHFKHGIAWRPAIVDDQPHLEEFENRATDLGSPCPTYCPERVVVFLEQGLERHTICPY